jgi:pilus assembly protein Flp/PilA
MLKHMRRLLRNSRGATAVEYGLVVSLIVIAMIAALRNVAVTTNNMWNNVASVVEKS